MAATMGRPAAKLGEVRIHRAASGRRTRRIKVLCDGRPVWRLYAAHLYEINHGQIPPGKVVLHADGDSLNDSLDNLVLGTRGDHFSILLECDRAVAKQSNRRAKALRQYNHETALLRREFGLLQKAWYPSLTTKRFVLRQPFARQRDLFAWLGVVDIPRALQVGLKPLQGRHVPTEGIAKVSEAEFRSTLFALLQPEIN